MKRIYVLNLDSRRIIMLAGGLFILLGFFLFIGVQIGSNDEVIHASEGGSEQSTESETVSANTAGRSVIDLNESESALPVKEADDMLPALDRKLGLDGGEKSIPVQSDPMSSGSQQKETASEQSKGGFYTIQIAALKSEKDAIKEKERFEKRGLNARVERGVRFWLVRAGKAQTRSGIEAALQKVKKIKNDAFVVYR